jgi:hypothetical protein
MDLYTLSQIRGRRLTPDEISFLKKNISRKKFLVKYCIWKQNRINGAYILLIIDKFPNKVRRTAMDNSIEVIETRALTDAEYDEQIENYGCASRIYECYDYRDIEWLIHEDTMMGAITPQSFIQECRKRGYTKQPDLFGGNYEYLV